MNRKRAKITVVGLAITGGLIGAAVVAHAASTAAHVTRPSARVADSRASASSLGLNPDDAVVVFELRNGQTVSVLADSSGVCLIREDQTRRSELCDEIAAVEDGRAISVLDECGASGSNLMEITGLAPQETSSVRMTWSDGTTEDASISHGAFKFEGTNPAPGSPYPTAIAWMRGASEAGSAVFPVQGDRFCMPTS